MELRYWLKGSFLLKILGILTMRGERDHFHGILYISEVEFVTWVWVPTTSDILTASFLLEIYINEMVSTGDAEISLHIRSPRASWVGGGGHSGVKTENTQSAKICLNFNFRGEGDSLIWNSKEGLSGEFGHKFTVCTETCLCITDSRSHVETNKIWD